MSCSKFSVSHSFIQLSHFTVLLHNDKQLILASFQRQLNLYGFHCVVRESDAGTYRHDLNLFHRDKLELCQQVKQSKQLREANAEYGFRHDDLDCVGVSRNHWILSRKSIMMV